MYRWRNYIILDCKRVCTVCEQRHACCWCRKYQNNCFICFWCYSISIDSDRNCLRCLISSKTDWRCSCQNIIICSTCRSSRSYSNCQINSKCHRRISNYINRINSVSCCGFCSNSCNCNKLHARCWCRKTPNIRYPSRIINIWVSISLN